MGTFGRAPNGGPAKLRGPRGLVCDDRALYVADCYNCCVKKFALTDGSLVGTFGKYGEGDGQMRYPHGLALSHDGTLYVADTSNGRVVAFDCESFEFKFAFPMNRGPDDNLLATLVKEREEQRSGGAAAAAAAGQLSAAAAARQARVAAAAAAARQPKQTHVRPAGLAVLGEEVFVTDAYNKRLQVFSLTGVFQRFLQPSYAEGSSRHQPILTLPEGLAAGNGRLYVSDKRGDAVHILDPVEGSSLQLLPFLMHRPHALSGVCTDGYRVYTIDEARNDLQVLQLFHGEDGAARPVSGGTPQSKKANQPLASARSHTSGSTGTPRSAQPSARRDSSPRRPASPRMKQPAVVEDAFTPRGASGVTPQRPPPSGGRDTVKPSPIIKEESFGLMRGGDPWALEPGSPFAAPPPISPRDSNQRGRRSSAATSSS